MKLDYYYDKQIQRVIKHLIRMFGGFQISNGYDENNAEIFKRVPCRFGDMNKQAAVVLNRNTENVVQSAPMMVINIEKLSLSRENVRGPVSENLVVGINKTDINGTYTNELDSYYEVERMNPVPWDLEFSVDIWTTSTKNKFELFEQIACLFSSTVPLQLSTNPLDWTSMSYVELMNYNYSSRSRPQGTDYSLDISQFNFKTMIWLSLPNKINRAKLINQVVANISTKGIDDMLIPSMYNWDPISCDVYTPGNHSILCKWVANDTIEVRLATRNGLTQFNGNNLSWVALCEYYSYSTESVMLSLLESLENSRSLILGSLTVSPNPNTPFIGELKLDTSTVPQPNIPACIRMIDPTKEGFFNLQDGRYVLTENISLESKNFIGNKGDILIIQNGEFTSIVPTEGDICDIGSNRYRFETVWNNIIQNSYAPGFWRINFTK